MNQRRKRGANRLDLDKKINGLNQRNNNDPVLEAGIIR